MVGHRDAVYNVLARALARPKFRRRGVGKIFYLKLRKQRTVASLQMVTPGKELNGVTPIQWRWSYFSLGGAEAVVVLSASGGRSPPDPPMWENI